jgi:hypothetical protein
MLDLFRAGEVIAPGRTNEEELALLAIEKVRGGRATTPPDVVHPPVSAAKTATPQPKT